MMTKFLVDANELVATAQVLDSCATEVADLGSGLASCARCAMPAGLQPQIDQLMAVADAALDEVAVRLYQEGIGLAERAILAARAGLSTMQGVVLGGPSASVSVIGGNGDPGFSVAGPGGSIIPDAVFASATVGGSVDRPFTMLGPDGMPASQSISSLMGATVVGGGGGTVFSIHGPDGGRVDPSAFVGLGPSMIGGSVGGLPNLGGGTATVGGHGDVTRMSVVGSDVKWRIGMTRSEDLNAVLDNLVGPAASFTGPAVRPIGGVDDDIIAGMTVNMPIFASPIRSTLTTGAGVLVDSLSVANSQPLLG